MILVTGAAGKTGRAVVAALTAREAPVRVLVRRAEQGAALRRLGAAEAIAGDMRHAQVWRDAADGVEAIYHICPNMAVDEMEIGRLALSAARDVGGPRFVYHSVLHPETEAMSHHWNKLRVEEMLLQSGLPFTVLQPASYMQNVLAGWDGIVSQGEYRVPYALETRLGMVDLVDVAQVASIALLDKHHEGATYQLCGTEVLTQKEITSALESALDCPVRAVQMPLDKWEQDARAAGMSEYAVTTLTAMFRFYECHGFWGNANVLRALLGREPTTFAGFLSRETANRSG